MSEKPALVQVGRIVHWVTLDGEVVPAIVVRVRVPEEGLVDLQVFHYNRGIELTPRVALGDGVVPGTWFWPPR